MSRTPASTFVISILAILCVVSCTGCAMTPPQRFEFAAERMGTTFRIVMYAKDAKLAKGVAEDAFRRIDELNAIFSDYDPLSEVSRLCALSRERVPTERRAISEPLFRVLLEAQWLSADTEGAFDVTIGPFTLLWRRAKRQAELPSSDRLAAARRAYGHQKLELDPKERTARLLARDMRIDLGGIAIGYTLDDLITYLKERGIESALIDGGGDVVVSDPPPGEDGWRIAIDDMLGEFDGKKDAVLLSNAAITTSGDGLKFVVIDGVRYSHIVDPKTGLGLTRRVAAVVIARAAIDADALATACCLLEPEAALRLLEERKADGRLVHVDESASRRIDETKSFTTRLVK